MRDEDVLRRAEEVGYIVTNKSQNHLRNDFFSWCKENERPYVTIKITGKYAEVEMDLSHLSYRKDLQLPYIQEVEALNASVKAKGEPHAGHVISSITVLAERAEDVAKVYVQIYKGNEDYLQQQ